MTLPPRLLVIALLTPAFHGAVAQTTTAPRLPQDSPREPQPLRRDAPLVIDTERFAEQAPPGAAGLRLRLADVQVSGNTALPRERLQPIWAPLIGQEVSLEQVFDAARKISAAYREAGYVLSQALVPRQEIDQARGVVRIRVAEGYVSRITIADDVAGRERLLAMLEPVRREKPLTLATLERHLLLLNDLPGVRAQASLRAAPEENAAALELVVARDPSAYSLSAHNRAAEAIGPVRLEASAERRGLFGAFDRHVLRWVGSGNERLNLLAYSGDAPLGNDGLQANWSVSASRSKPKGGTTFQLDTESENAAIGLSYPLVRSRNTNVGLRATLTAYDGSSDIVGGLALTREKLRAVRIGITADRVDPWGGLNLIDLEASKGLDALGASKPSDADLGVAGSNPQFSKATLYAARLQSLGGEWSLLIAVTGQATGSILASSERFGLGGETFLRAYDPSELLGDTGLGGKVELRFNTSLATVLGTFYTYYDEGKVRVRSVSSGTAGISAASVGAGVRVSAPNGLRGFLEVAKPLRRAPVQTGDLDPRVFAGIGIDL